MPISNPKPSPKPSPNSHKKRIVISFLGTVLDAGLGKKRHNKWRPNIAIHQHDLNVVGVELFVGAEFRELADKVTSDIHAMNPDVQVNAVPMPLTNPWDFSEVYEKLSDWASTYPFDTDNYEYLTHITTGTHVAQICLFLLVERCQIPSLLLQTSPPKRQHDEHSDSKDKGKDKDDNFKDSFKDKDKFKPKNASDVKGSYETIDLTLARYDVLQGRLAKARDTAQSYLKSGIATRSIAFNAMIAQIEQVALGSNLPILLTGATGAGKSMLARRIYELKKARHLLQGDFVDVNCATLKGDGAMSALFGHRKGAFTGAVSARSGYLATAHRGLLFLDEIGELGADEQAMLLTALEEKRFYPLGSDTPVASEFTLIAGTNRDLRADVAAGTFRGDLYARINIWHYQLPALADRREDIEPSIAHILAVASTELGRTCRFDKQGLTLYLDFALSERALWRGNFRELSASILRLATLATGGVIGVKLVQGEIERLLWEWQDANSTTMSEPIATAPTYNDKAYNDKVQAVLDSLDTFDRLQLMAVLDVCRTHDSLASAGRALFDVSRQKRKAVNDSDRLRKYLSKYDLQWSDLRL